MLKVSTQASIPEALEAINYSLQQDNTTDKNTKDAIMSFIRLSFENAYVAFEEKVYKPNVGIPTGGSLSRHIADIFLHWLLFVEIFPKISDVQAITL